MTDESSNEVQSKAFVISHEGSFKRLRKLLESKGHIDRYAVKRDKKNDYFIGLTDSRKPLIKDRRKGIIVIKDDSLLEATLKIVKDYIDYCKYLNG